MIRRKEMNPNSQVMIWIGIKISLVALLGFSVEAVTANSVMPPTPRVFSSPRGDRLVRIQASESLGKNTSHGWTTRIVVFSYKDHGGGDAVYERVVSFEVNGHPSVVIINDAGTRIVLIDQLYKQSHGEIARVYDHAGDRLASWTLKDFFLIEDQSGLGKYVEFRRTNSSAVWRGAVRLSESQNLLWILPPDHIKCKKEAYRTPSEDYLLRGFVIDLKKLEVRRR